MDLKHFPIALLFIFVMGGAFRFIGLNWDQNSHFHPDERFLTMVAGAMSWPDSLSGYLDTASSPLNPHNVGFGFYVYGTYPVILVKFIAEVLGKGDYNQLTLVGRAVSAVVDLGTLLLVYLISLRLFRNKAAAVLAAFSYSISVLPIQLSHFFAVDSYLTFFLTLGFYLLLIGSPFLGIAFGLSLASKISAVIFIPVIALGFIFFRVKLSRVFLFIILSLITLHLAQPYLFTGLFRLNSKVLANWQQLNSFNRPYSNFPPGTQWAHTPPGYSLENNLLWGLGLPLGLAVIAGLLYHLIHRHKSPPIFLSLFWTLLLFIYQSFQYVRPLRYFYPIYPTLTIFAGYLIYLLFKKFVYKVWLLLLVTWSLLIWPFAFVSIYSRPHSRTSASRWLLQNIPPGSRLSCEVWDDCLPWGGAPHIQFVEFPLYDLDTLQKWATMRERLSQVDYIVLSSNRLYGSIMTAPEIYPITIQFYQSLFDGSLGFVPIAQFTSRPNIPIPGLNLCLTPPSIRFGKIAAPIQDCPLSGISIVDDYADEAFTVIDHPKVIIFKSRSNGFNKSGFQ